MKYPYLKGKIALVTGGSRGIGAATAVALAKQGANVVLTYRNKAARAEEVAEEVRSHGVRAMTMAVDLTVREDVDSLMKAIKKEFGRLDLLILNASGGMEKDLVAENPDYPLLLNRDAQLWTLEAAMSLMPKGGRVVYVTSHWAHFYGQEGQERIAVYEPVAYSKHEGEKALLALIPHLEKHGIRLTRISGDMVEGTITPKLLERAQPGTLKGRSEMGTPIPTVHDMAAAVVKACGDDKMEQGEVIYVGEAGMPASGVKTR